jgi:hypothetical protein
MNTTADIHALADAIRHSELTGAQRESMVTLLRTSGV